MHVMINSAPYIDSNEKDETRGHQLSIEIKRRSENQ